MRQVQKEVWKSLALKCKKQTLHFLLRAKFNSIFELSVKPTQTHTHTFEEIVWKQVKHQSSNFFFRFFYLKHLKQSERERKEVREENKRSFFKEISTMKVLVHISLKLVNINFYIMNEWKTEQNAFCDFFFGKTYFLSLTHKRDLSSWVSSSLSLRCCDLSSEERIKFGKPIHGFFFSYKFRVQIWLRKS